MLFGCQTVAGKKDTKLCPSWPAGRLARNAAAQRAEASSSQPCLLSSADSEGERGRASVASVSERACASQRRCVLFLSKREVWLQKHGLLKGVPSSFRSLPSWGAAPRPHADFQRGTPPGTCRTRHVPTHHTHSLRIHRDGAPFAGTTAGGPHLGPHLGH